MTHSNRFAIALLLVATAATANAYRPDPQQPRHDHDSGRTVGSKVTLTSCVERGQTSDTFILTRTADVPVHPASHGRVVYWLDNVKRLREHVGHQVRIIGTVTDVKQEEMEVKLGGDASGGWTVEIEAPGRDVRTTPDKAGVDPAGRSARSDDIKTTLVKLKVDEVAMAAATCQLK